MAEHQKHRLLRPETLTAFGIILVAALLLGPTFELRPISALLPGAMLFGLLGLSVLLLIADQRNAGKGEPPEQVVTSPYRVAGAFLLIAGYALAVDFLGFYLSTAATIPLVAYIFGYRSPFGLALATAIVVGAIYLIFELGMSRDFPAGRLWLS